jgi:nucleoside-diphosphate-sugar epimerase
MKALGGRKKAVILGASGFIGINLARALAARNYDLALFSRRQSPHFPLGCAVVTGTLAAPPLELMTEKFGAKVVNHGRYIAFQMAEARATRMTRREIPPESEPRASLLLPRQIQLPREAT